jgi:hypothetical protein
MFYDEENPIIENSSIMFCHSDVIWSCIYEDALDNDSIIDDIIGEVTDNECYGAYANGKTKDDSCPVSYITFDGERINSSVKEKAVKFFAKNYEKLLRSIYTPIKEIITGLHLACEQNDRRKKLSLFFCNENTKKHYEDSDSGISWSVPLHCDSGEKSYIPIRFLENGVINYINFAFVDKKDLLSHEKELSDSPIKSKIFRDFLTLVTEDVELLNDTFAFYHRYGYIKTILIGIDPNDVSNSVVVDAHTVGSKQMYSMIHSCQQTLINGLIEKIKQQYLCEYNIGYFF